MEHNGCTLASASASWGYYGWNSNVICNIKDIIIIINIINAFFTLNQNLKY